MLTRRSFFAGFGAGATAEVRPVQWNDLPTDLQRLTGATSATFDALRFSIDRSTTERLRRGEDEHLAYYVLQSRRFTSVLPVEPALIALAARVPREAEQRIQAFIHALGRASSDERMRWWQEHLTTDRRTPAGLRECLREATEFLRDKEVANRGPAVYQTRGHSSDTSLAPAFTVWSALQIIKRLDRIKRLEQVLLAGPGLDFAPRTAMREDVPPRSYQPHTTVHALGDAGQTRADLTCVDVNERVLSFVRRAPRAISFPREAGTPEFRAYLARLGAAYRIPDTIRFPFIAERMNIITERLSRQFDVVIATNVLLYMRPVELALAIGNISAMLRPGGWFIHNELRPQIDGFSNAVNIPVVQVRTLEIANGTKAPLMDAIILHRKR